MKKFLLMIAAVAAFAFVACDKQQAEAEYQFDAEKFGQELLAAGDSASAAGLLDNVKAIADSLIQAGKGEAAQSLLDKVKETIEANKEALDAKLPGLTAGLTGAVDAAKSKFAEVKDAAVEAASDAAEAGKAQVDSLAGAAKDAAGEAVEAGKAVVEEKAAAAVEEGKEKAAEAVQNAADKAKGLLGK